MRSRVLDRQFLELQDPTSERFWVVVVMRLLQSGVSEVMLCPPTTAHVAVVRPPDPELEWYSRVVGMDRIPAGEQHGRTRDTG